jgi:hypothetical protein
LFERGSLTERPQPASSPSETSILSSLTPPFISPRPKRKQIKIKSYKSETALKLTSVLKELGEVEVMLKEQLHSPAQVEMKTTHPLLVETSDQIAFTTSSFSFVYPSIELDNSKPKEEPLIRTLLEKVGVVIKELDTLKRRAEGTTFDKTYWENKISQIVRCQKLIRSWLIRKKFRVLGTF